MVQHSSLHIVWLTPSYRFGELAQRYTLPLLEEFQRVCPGTVFITTGKIHPYYEEILNIRVRGNISRMYLRPYASSIHYSRGFNRLSPAIVLDLLNMRPQLVISQEFTLWTMLAALFKPLGRWKLLVLWTGSSPGADLLDDRTRLFIRRFVAKRTDAFVTNSFSGKTYLHEYLLAPEDRIFRIIFKPGDPAALSKKPFSHPLMYDTPRPRFLYVGQLIPRKGLNYLLSAWSKVQNFSSRHGSLLIIGSGVQKDELLEQVCTLNLKNVYFIGQVEYASLSSWYKSCDVFILPTLEDIWSNVVPEAMSFGKPVLCSKYAGSAELICKGENGFTFDPTDTDQLARLMLKFVNSPQLIEKFGQKSKEIMNPFTIATAVEAIHSVIRKNLCL